MDYKYIEQLLERYWNCETSVEEEQILRIFFQQKELPAHLRRYRSLFTYQEEAAGMKLGDDFDKRVLAEIERPEVPPSSVACFTTPPNVKSSNIIAAALNKGIKRE
jgi:hypothetical protein